MDTIYSHILERCTPEYYNALGLHIPYQKRMYAIYEFMRICKHTGIVTADIPEMGLTNIPTAFTDYVVRLLTERMHMEYKRLLKQAVSFLAVVANLYMLAKSIYYGMYDMVCCTVITLFSQFFHLSRCIGGRVVGTIEKFQDVAFKLYLEIAKIAGYDEPQSGAPSGVLVDARPNAIHGILLCTTALASMCGYDMGERIKTFSHTITSVEKVTNIFSETMFSLFNIDITGYAKLQDAASSLEREGQALLDTTMAVFISTKLAVAREWLHHAEQLIRMVKSTNFNTTAIIGMHAQIAKRISDSEQQLIECRPRPTPAGLYLYGAPGHGKTEFVYRYMIPALAATFGLKGERAKHYDLNSGKYFRQLKGESWAVYDEFGADKEGKKDGMDYSTMNTILSGGTATIPGASIDSKHQTAGFNGVFLLSNVPPEKVSLQMNCEAKKAFISRFDVLEVVDPYYSKQHTRTDQPHRAPDFSHLSFNMEVRDYATIPHHLRYRSDGTARDIPIRRYLPEENTTQVVKGLRFTAPEVLELFVGRIRRNQENFVKLSSYMPAVTTAQFNLWNPLLDEPAGALDEPQANTRPKVFWISGASGVGKSQVYVPDIISLLSLITYQVHEVRGFVDGGSKVLVQAAKGIKTVDPLRVPATTAFILDDVVNPDTQEGQFAYQTFCNCLRPTNVVVCVSNYGKTGMFHRYLGFLSGALRVPDRGVPGFLSRTGIRTLHHYEVTRTGIYNHKEGWVTHASLLNKIMVAVLNIELSVRRVSELPEIDWAVDIDIPEGTPTVNNVVEILRQTTTHPRLALQVASILSSNTTDTPVQLMQRVIDHVKKHHSNLTVRVQVGERVYAYADSVIYALHDLSIGVEEFGETFFTLNCMGNLETYPVDTFHGVLEGEVSVACDGLNVVKLISVQRNSPRIWKQLCDRYSLPFATKCKLFFKDYHKRATDFFDNLTDNILFKAIILIAVAAIIYIIRHYNTQSENTCVCKKLGTGEICPYDIPEAKRGGGKSKFSHFKSIKVNGNTVCSSSAEDTLVGERLWFEISRGAKAGKTAFRADVGGGIGYDVHWDDGWHATLIDTPQAALLEQPVTSRVTTNIAKIHASDGSHIHVLFLKPGIAVVPRHWISAVQPWTYGEHTLHPLHEDSYRELLFLYIRKKGKIVNVPGKVDILKYIPSLDLIRSITTATILAEQEGRYSMLTQDYVFKEQPIPFSHDSLKHWGANVGLTSWGEYADFTRLGDCGLPVLGHFSGQLYLIGIHAARRVAQQKFASVVLCSEVISEALGKYREVMCGADQPQMAVTALSVDGQSHTVAGPVTYPEEFQTHVQTRAPRCAYAPAGAVAVRGYIKNPKPMDARQKKNYYPEFSKTVEGFDTKVPALTEDEILEYHRDKVPLDQVNIPRVHLIRSKRLESNYYKPELYSAVLSVAQPAADYYRLYMRSQNINPISLDDALNGNYTCLGVVESTSAGVTMMKMFGARLKSDLIDNSLGNRHILKPPVAHLTQQQYDAMGRGELLMLPADANLKSENLPPEKDWKKRVFYNVPLPTILNFKRIFAPVQHLFQSFGHKSPFIFDLYPTQDWNDMAVHLLEVGNKIVCLDVSGYDHSLNGAVIAALGHFIIPFFECNNPRPMLRKRIHTIFEMAAFMDVIYGDTICTKQGGLPSGMFGTSLIDAAAWLMMLLDAWTSLTFQPVGQFFENVRVKFCGDDMIASIHDDYIRQFNGITISTHLSQKFEMKITPAENKAGVVVPHMSILEASFCSRGFQRMDGHPSIFIPRLKTSAIYSALMYSRLHCPYERYAQYLQIRHEIYPYGKERYEQYERELTRYANRIGAKHVPHSYSDTMEAIWQVVISPDKRSKEMQERKIVQEYRNTQHIMSAEVMKEMRNILRNQVAASHHFGHFIKQYGDTKEMQDLRILYERDLIDWDGVGQLKKPGSSTKYPVIRANSMAAFCALAGLTHPILEQTCRFWLSARPATEYDRELTERELRYDQARRTHHGVAYILGMSENNIFTNPMDAWEAASVLSVCVN